MDWNDQDPRPTLLERGPTHIVILKPGQHPGTWLAATGHTNPNEGTVQMTFYNHHFIESHEEWPQGWLWTPAPARPA